MLRSISSRKLAEWMAFYTIENEDEEARQREERAVAGLDGARRLGR